ncbi:MAG: hypothetical protein A3F84_26135 [Candidatus Handelsmanbacteria bacterium RIFCSPLOWO2_12_FULL_64_10]|uniref:Uncharacterized protein n=1 Tax=Handelsmanbacteria sp. (strain RIFCSPLOWO2_12_FULL_64_10) TaxID=1817868 RepID=A0A1F6CB20_HANXR|nr:MAG: hypothetical protein A3F84_26135 [Candidatus Handelsmanbacteria bacterium RIFCSPLOWO2_12_FULL_64_10]
MISWIEHKGIFIHECPLPGERRADHVVPAHPNGVRVSRRRWLVVYATRGFRGVDDDRSIVYQLRDGGFDGPVIKEGMLARSIDDWDPLGDGSQYVRQFGHPVAFGVPKGAVLGGRPAVSANVFVAKWRVCARVLIRDGGYLLWNRHPAELTRQTQAVQWMQFRLNEAEDDIEILQPAQQLRQKGYETGPAFCAADVAYMNQSYVQAVPFNASGTEWMDVNHFDHKDMHHREGGWIAPLRYRFGETRGLYEWVQIGPLIGPGLFEGSIAPYHGDWVIAGRPIKGGPIGWVRTGDPFGSTPEVVYPAEPTTNAPLTIYHYADGVVRLLTGDRNVSPYDNGRNPLYCWEIDPDREFGASNRRVAFDTYAAGVPIPTEHHPLVDMAKLLPHSGGNTQIIAHRVRTCALLANDPEYGRLRRLMPGDFDATAIYWARIHYSEEFPGQWEFE